MHSPFTATRDQCPTCGESMIPAERTSSTRRHPAPVRIGSPTPPIVAVPVWRCRQCQVDRARMAGETDDAFRRRSLRAVPRRSTAPKDRATTQPNYSSRAHQPFAFGTNLLAATISHEIRGPLTALAGYVKLVEQEDVSSLNPKQRTHLSRIARISDHLLAVVNDVLDDTQRASGPPLRQGGHQIGDVIESALMVTAPAAQTKGVELRNAVSRYGTATTFEGDEVRVRQILINLLDNAVKFTPAGGSVKVSAGLAESASRDALVGGAGPWVYVRVDDNGPGIAAEYLDTIFEPFEQPVPTPAENREGTGLGLAVSRHLARLLGGDITVRSQVGQGATFVLWLRSVKE